MAVHGSTNADSLLLSSTEIDALLSNLRLVASWEDLNVWLEGASLEDTAVASVVELLVEEDVVLEGCIQQPGFLCGIGNAVSFPRFYKEILEGFIVFQ